ncbi:hypothetical protein [uncultured Chitinophaga sp.]|uniref:hypothetical protein n=1 Tax=uncultured Chitinophaga sp. TaxID=339340 RepID=UPI0025EAC1B2|nr:hypothetical protein [uncultured Chitinophaga sp.]
MRKICLSVIILLACGLSSCLTTMQPLVTQDKVVVDNRVCGDWNTEDGELRITPFMLSETRKSIGDEPVFSNGKPILDNKISPADKKRAEHTFELSFTRNGVKHYMLMQMMKINGALYGNLVPLFAGEIGKDKVEGGMNIAESEYMPGYTIAKIDVLDNGQLSVKFADGDFIKKQLLAGNMKLKYEHDALFGTFVVTASSADLQQFVAKYGNDERLFGSKNAITLNKKG